MLLINLRRLEWPWRIHVTQIERALQARVMYFMFSIPLLSELSTVGNKKVLHNIVITECTSINRAVDCTEEVLRFSYFFRHHSSVLKGLDENMKT